MAMVKYMIRKKDTFWYRRRVKKIGEVVLSLKTKSYELALLRRSFIDFQVNKLLFKGFIDTMTVKEIRDIVNKYKTYFQEADDYNEFEEQRDKDLSITLNGNFFGGHTKEALGYALQRYHDIHASNDIEMVRLETEKILPRTNLQNDFTNLENPRDIEIFHWELFKTEWTILFQAYEAQKNISKTPDEKLPEWMRHPEMLELISSVKANNAQLQQQAVVQHTNKYNKTISQLLNEYIQEKAVTSEWSDKNRRDLVYVLGHLANWFDDKVANLLTREDFTNFRDKVIVKLPVSTKWNIFQDKTIKEVIEIVEEQKLQTLSKITINKHLRRIHQVFEWAQSCGYIEKNLTKGLSFKDKKGMNKALDAKNPYTREELKKIFEQTPWFTDNIITQLKNNPENVLIPLMCLFTGAKPTELALLDISAFKLKNGILGIEFIQMVKTAYSYRFTPLSDKLIEIGIMKYVRYMKKQKETRLFPKVVAYKGDGTSFTNAYSRYNRKHITDEKKKTFYSIKHFVTQSLKNKKQQIYIINDIVGHSDGHGNKDNSVYGERMPEEVLQEVINECLIYDFIDFSHIKDAIEKIFK